MIIRSNTQESKDLAKADEINGGVIADYIDGISGRRPMGAAEIGGEQELDNEQRKRLPYVMAAQQPCLLCHGPQDFVNYWKVPDRIAKGRKDAAIFFSLCRECRDLPGHMALVTQELLSRVEGKSYQSPLVKGDR